MAKLVIISRSLGSERTDRLTMQGNTRSRMKFFRCWIFKLTHQETAGALPIPPQILQFSFAGDISLFSVKIANFCSKADCIDDPCGPRCSYICINACVKSSANSTRQWNAIQRPEFYLLADNKPTPSLSVQ